jgi:hypothetical protein
MERRFIATPSCETPGPDNNHFMKINSVTSERGSVLMVALLTISIMTFICAVSLHIATQNANGAMQVASWQQALTGAESALDQAIDALNLDAQGSSSAWTNQSWYKVSSSSLPTTQPSGGSSTTKAPKSGEYNYFIPSAIPLQGEGNNSVTSWVTVDTVGSTFVDTSGKQWYRVRATGVANAPAIARVSNNKLDNDLRNTLGLRFNRKTGAAITGTGTNISQVTRSIEVILSPVATSIWTRGVTLKNWLAMSGGGVIDSFDSGNPFKSTNGLYDVTKRQSNAGIGLLQSNSTASDLKSTYVYGSIQYSGPAIKNTSNVQGTISSPFNTTIPDTSDPTWASGSYTSYAGGTMPFASATTGSKNSPALIKVNGDMTLLSGNTVTITSGSNSANNSYLVIWVTGNLKVMSGGFIKQDQYANVTFYVDGDITTAAGGFTNASGLASNLSMVGVGTGHTVTVSGSGNFIGTVNAPADAVVVSGSGNFSGAVIGNNLTISGGASFHYDEALGKGSGSSSVGNYAFASWFEDNSDPTRGIIY